MVKGEYVDDILSGRKKATIRLGIVKLRYKELIVHGGGKPIAKVRVTNVRYKRVAELTDEDARLDGFRNKDELLEALKKAYGEIKPNDYVTIIEFEVIQDLSKLEPQHPYLGLEPADVARLALRYLKDRMNKEEIDVLTDLTRTNSIRATSIRLFGDLGKRWKVRKVLRKALRLLAQEGYIKTRQDSRAKRG
ncbi:MAG TPA: ASCH domain-containing protein [Pyrodictiaceae archaeon]|nr:ASCH domain-containing protein [Pyrodictiaceae archaeon]HIQ10717.1 ASCH domain-containing protein [Pyrodictium sp.]HIQ55509.1 ASCH domain-containing protein [Pyrodictium sp.]